jgi:hypothetical protein
MHLVKIILGLFVFLFAGCASLPERLSASVPPQVQLVEGNKEQVYAAARQAFKRLDFNVTRSSLGQLEAASAIHSSETFGDSRQLVAKLSIREADPGKSEVELLLTEEVTSQSMGGSRRQPLRENGFFGLYFAMLQQVLQEQAPGKPAEKN